MEQCLYFEHIVQSHYNTCLLSVDSKLQPLLCPNEVHVND